MKDKLIAEQRMKLFNEDVLHWKDYDYVVINDNLEKCCEEIVEFVDLELKNNKKIYNKELIQKHVNSLVS